MKETELFEPVKKWLEDGGHEVYSEVRANKYGGRRADVVGVHGNIVTVVEMKVTLSLDLIEQAVLWKNHAHYIYVAVPHPKKGYLNDFAVRLLCQYGIGILTVNFDSRGLDGTPSVSLYPYRTMPKVHRNITSDLRDSLTEYHKDGPPGGHQGGGYITAYRITMIHVKEYLDKELRFAHREWGELKGRNGWRTTTEILEEVTTHYSSPKQSLAKALHEFEQDWCESKIECRKLYFRHKKPEGNDNERVN